MKKLFYWVALHVANDWEYKEPGSIQYISKKFHPDLQTESWKAKRFRYLPSQKMDQVQKSIFDW